MPLEHKEVERRYTGYELTGAVCDGCQQPMEILSIRESSPEVAEYAELKVSRGPGSVRSPLEEGYDMAIFICPACVQNLFQVFPAFAAEQKKRKKDRNDAAREEKARKIREEFRSFDFYDWEDGWK